MTTSELIDRHYKQIEVLEVIASAETQIRLNNQSLSGFPGEFPTLGIKYRHHNVILQMAIERLTERYNKL